jgi:hypothetical protein
MNQKTINPKQPSLSAGRSIHGIQFFKLKSESQKITPKTGKLPRMLIAVLLAGVSAGRVWAQGDVPSGTITGSGAGPYTYNLTFSDASSATSPIGSVWYAWIPFAFYLPGTPTTASAPFGWSASVVNNSIEFVSSSSAYDIAPGSSLSGFSYQASFSPATLAGTPNSGLSDAYVGGIESDGGQIFSVNTVPEPSPAAFFGVMGLVVFGWRRLRVRK